MPVLTDLYSNTLSALTGVRELMLSAQFQNSVPPGQGPAAAQTLLNVEHGILALSNASLGDIAKDMQINAADLTTETTALNNVVKALGQAQSVMDAAGKIVATLGKFIPLL